ncbi:BadF/BadG/BcrA/BcrD ATPase family protein [Streptomyces sp. NPDC089799]|uniref:N-acetylglucosamine kinase n=1 Tax=Streptomyces sp. NPDC089799 TaxID=3155066 RepID=UPI00343991CB
MGLNQPAVLAVDAGNTKTDAALIGRDGTVLGTGRAGGFRPQRDGIEAAVDVLGVAVSMAVGMAGARAADHPGAAAGGSAGLSYPAGRGNPDAPDAPDHPAAPGRTGAPPYAAHVSACLANADLPVEEAALEDALHRRGWGGVTAVRNDTFAVLRAGLGPGDGPRGVAVVCGAGINCAGMLPDGRTARFAALGAVSGDWGGGAGLAGEALWFAARAEDGRGEPTALAEVLPAHFGRTSMAELIEALHLGAVPVARKHELVPVLFAAAAAGDRVALALVHRQADEIVAMAAVALGRLGLLDEEVPVVLGGSVVAARHPELNDRIAERLAERAPRARLSVVTAPPVLGAALLGLDAAGAPAAAYDRLRGHFPGERAHLTGERAHLTADRTRPTAERTRLPGERTRLPGK